MFGTLPRVVQSRAIRLALSLCSGLGPLIAGATSELYAFVDAAGTLHITDRLGDVPEPYQAIYRQEANAKAAAKGKQQPAGPQAAVEPADEPPPAMGEAPAAAVAPATTAASQAADRRRWQQEMAAWRALLKTRTQLLQEAEQAVARAANPVLRQTPAGRAALEQAQANLERIRADVLAARRMLLEALPKRAREEHVPPQWLLP